MIPRFGYAVRETVFGTYGVFKVNTLGVMLSGVIVEYDKEHVALRVANALHLEREFETKDTEYAGNKGSLPR